MKSNIYDGMKISKQRSISSIRNESHMNITINEKNVCQRGSEECFNNGTGVCYSCCIFSGDTNLEILFRASPWKVPVSEVSLEKPNVSLTQEQEKLLKPPITELIKIVTTEEDAEDIPHFVNHVSESIIHQHSGNTVLHKHYPIYGAILGTRCFICNFPIIGFIICGHCESMFELSEKSN